MSSKEIAVSIRDVSKCYTITHNQVKHSTFAEAVLHRLRHPLERSEKETFWALKGVTADIEVGEVVGVIGRNGAGKSTLLKILSRITEPTAGSIELYGRVGSLLEVGTGFHPELTGRENIFLNGHILGMNKREIQRQFDAIVDFAGVEQFLDTPVKRYSSGMYVRLAFAVAAHLNPEILVVDEVLAVGDASFQKKCLGKMQDVARSGRTVLFVSHNMQSISLLCTKGLLLRDGAVEYMGQTQHAINEYLRTYALESRSDSLPDRRPGTGEYRFLDVRASKEMYEGAEEKEIQFRIERRQSNMGKMYLSAHVVDWQGVTQAQCDARLLGLWLADAEAYEGSFRIKTPWLKPGSYRIDLFLCVAGMGFVDKYEGACSINVSPVLPYPYSISEEGTAYGQVFADYSWEAVPTTLARRNRPTPSLSGV